MRVALVGRFPLKPELVAGGVETSTSNLLAGLHKIENMELHVLTFRPGLTQRVDVDLDGIHFHYLPSPRRLNTLTLYIRTRLALKKFLREIKPDIVHALDCLDSGYVCLKAASNYPLVLSIHGIIREEARHLSRPTDKLRTYLASLLIQRYCVRNARYLIQPTRYPEEYFGSCLSGTIIETGNATADRFFELESQPEPGRLLYSGRIIPLKRLPDLLEAVNHVREEFPNVFLNVAGAPADPAYESLLKSLVADADLKHNVSFLGQLSFDQLVEEYAKCSILVLTSAHENSPMVIGEAMAAGKPVVATRVGGIPYLVQEGETGFLIDPGDIDALGDRIVRLLRDHELQRKMGVAAKESAERRFRSRAVAKRVRQVYGEAISDSKTFLTK